MQKLETELKLRGFSANTIKAYLIHNSKFLEFIGKSENSVSEDDIKAYIAYLMADRKLAPSSVALARSALKFYYDEVLGRDIVNIRTPKGTKKIPIVLTRAEVKRLIEGAGSKKSELMLKLLYSSGLRLSEAINLKIKDLELEERMGWVRHGKGGKDRMFILAEALVKELKKYIEKRKLSGYVFPNKEGGPLTPNNIQKIVARAALQAKITKKVSPHTLRHSFATHLLESGVGIRHIQELLGHANLQTTQIYTKVSTEELKKIRSPLDNI